MVKNMKIEKTKLPGVYILEPEVSKDNRGIFMKPFNKNLFDQNGLVSNFEENFYSISNKNVIRGMHFQIPPQQYVKIVYVPHGSILDVVLDLRKNSPTYGQHISLELSDKNNKMIYIPTGCAHGFLSLEDNSCTMYLQTKIYSAEYDKGIAVDSFNMDWGITNPILSDRDADFPKLNEFDSPFIYSE